LPLAPPLYIKAAPDFIDRLFSCQQTFRHQCQPGWSSCWRRRV